MIPGSGRVPGRQSGGPARYQWTMPLDPADPHNPATGEKAAMESIVIATEGDAPEAHARKIEELLRGHEGVKKVAADPGHARVRITFDARRTHVPDLHDDLLKAGYKPSAEEAS